MEKEKMIATVQENIAKIESKDFNVYFFVLVLRVSRQVILNTFMERHLP